MEHALLFKIINLQLSVRNVVKVFMNNAILRILIREVFLKINVICLLLISVAMASPHAKLGLNRGTIYSQQ